MSPLFNVIVVTAAAGFGAAVGSFLNVCVYRLPRAGLRVYRPARSFCPACGFQIPWQDNIPILSWALLGGRCRSCRSPIAVRYLLVEALTAMLFALVVYRYVVELDGQWAACLSILLLVVGLIVATFVDIEIRQIPDEITVGGMHLLPFVALAVPGIHTWPADGGVATLLAKLEGVLRVWSGRVPDAFRGGVWLPSIVAVGALVAFVLGCILYHSYRRVFLRSEPRRFRDVSLAGVLAGSSTGVLLLQILRPEVTTSPVLYSFWMTLLGMLAGSALVYLVRIVGGRVFRKPAMGFGDVKLMGLLGGFTGGWGAVAGFFLACVIGSVVGVVRLCVTKDRYLPFGPFLAAGCLVLILWPGAFESLCRWYLSMFAI